MKYFPNHLIQTNTKWKKPVIPTRLGLWVPNVNIWKKKKMHRQIARFIALKYFTTNVSEVEKNALKCQFDKSQKNIFHMCLHLGILKQDGRSNSHSYVRLKHQLLRSWFKEISPSFFFSRGKFMQVFLKRPPLFQIIWISSSTLSQKYTWLHSEVSATRQVFLLIFYNGVGKWKQTNKQTPQILYR